jgi:cytochrome c biogenesis protein CcdA
MFGQLRVAKENLHNSFAAQFDHYQGQLVYRRLMKGPPVVVTEVERDDFIADFDKFVPRWFLGMIAGFVTIICGLIVLDETRILQTPDWMPILGMFPVLIVMAVFQRRAMTAPDRALALRAPMGGERSPKEVANAFLLSTSWNLLITPLIIGIAISCLVAVACVKNPSILTDYPFWMLGLSVLGIYLVIGSAINIHRKRLLERSTLD